MEDFVDPLNHFPIDFVQTYLTKEFENKFLIQENGLKNRIIYMISEQKEDQKTKKKVQTYTYEGPYNLYSENDLQNIIFLKQARDISQLIDLDSPLFRIYEGQTALSIFYDDMEILEIIK